MKIFLIGASGSIGWPLFNHLKKKFITIGTYNKNYSKYLVKFSFNNKNEKNKILKQISCEDIVIILSAETNVRWVHQNPKKSYQINTLLTNNFISDLIKKKTRIIYISSAEVFNGRKGFYNESSKPNPVNVYGKTKYAVEKYLGRSKYRNYHIIRTGQNVNMSDKFRCMVKDTYITLLGKDPKMASDNLFTITHMKDFNKSIEKLIRKKTKEKVFHLCSSEVLSRTKFADYIIKSSKLKNLMKYKIVKFKDIGYKEPRACKNNINNKLSKKLLKLKFLKSEIVIKEKVKLLDKIYEKRYSK